MNKNKDVSVMLKEAGILFAITLIAGLILGFVYDLTKEPIKLQAQKAVRDACEAVFPDADYFAEKEYELNGEVSRELAEKGIKAGTVYEARSESGDRLGYIIAMTTTEGYGGNIVLYVGILNDRTVSDVSILEISETPGLGMRAGEVLVPQFHNKTVQEFKYTKNGSTGDNEIDAISGATVTTKAFVEAVNGGLIVFDDLMKGGGQSE
jgi:electron transport complex protein RnfG